MCLRTFLQIKSVEKSWHWSPGFGSCFGYWSVGRHLCICVSYPKYNWDRI